MHVVRSLVLVVLIGIAGLVNAADEMFDRSAEIDKYVELMATGTRGQLALVAKEIYGSGISDQRLATAIYDRLYRERKSISGERVDLQFGVFMVKALASTGSKSAKEQLETLHSKVSNSKVQSTCRDEIKLVDWHHQRDVVMASTANHHEGDDANVSRLINLLKSNDISFKHWAVERMNWDKVLDPRLMQVIAAEVQVYVDHNGGRLDSEADDTMANFVKLLGYSRDVQYRPLLIAVSKLTNVSPGVKRHAKYAMDKLY